ncbi:MAG: adenylyl-sulfate kinase [Verrucomicrobia bacterium]|nr:adenylyl-sulfate kinase [Verrucomicrobiota bacterium]
MSESNNIFSEFDRMLGRDAKESQLKQKGHVFWLYGLSGSGKSTIADKVERSLVAKGHYIKLLDGDNVRTGLNKDLGFTDADRSENIRRIAEVARLFLDAGFVVITSFISPLKEYRDLAESIIGEGDFTKVYINASFSTCSERDVKGLYAKAKKGAVSHFTGKDSLFEAPSDSDEDWILDTEQFSASESTEELVNKILPIIKKI